MVVETQAMLKRLVMLPLPGVRFPHRDRPTSDVLPLVFLARDDMPGKMLGIRCAHILAIHKVTGPLKSSEVRS